MPVKKESKLFRFVHLPKVFLIKFQNLETCYNFKFLLMDVSELTKEYSNGEVTIVWKRALCKHAAACVKNNPDAFKPKEKPWITTGRLYN